MPLQRALAGTGPALAPDAQGADLFGHRRHRRRAATTSLPEQLGGSRNWDYRFCWLRDATLTLMALMSTGLYEEARAWRDWLLRSVAGSPSQIQIMYGVAGERQLPELEVPWLPGYHGSTPVRIGNAAAGQLQLDVYGELIDALYQGRRQFPAIQTGWALQLNLIEHLEQTWEEADEGIGEVRGGRRHSTFSKIMAWVAFTAPCATPSDSRATTSRSSAGTRCAIGCMPRFADMALTRAATPSRRASARRSSTQAY